MAGEFHTGDRRKSDPVWQNARHRVIIFRGGITVNRKNGASMKFDPAVLKRFPKVLLHEHLDGVLRPQTLIELAKDTGYAGLPTGNPQELAEWFHQGANQGSLPKYLEGFVHTIAVMQTEEALERVAYEQAEDLREDGVVYFETRFAPIFHTQKGLSHQQVVSAVLKGLERGRKDFGISSGLIICAMRNMDVSRDMAELAVDFRERGVVGFDLAGEEGGFPPKKHVDAFHYIQRQNFNITIHAGEGFGKESIWQAIQYCGAHRIGHGTRLIDDIAVADGKAVKLGNLAQYVLDKRIPLEICLISNVHTGAAPSLAEHPFKILYQEKFRVTLNTDNRLMSNTTMTKEFEAAADTFGLSLDDFEKITINAMKSAFLPYSQRCDFIYSVIKPGYAKIRASLTAKSSH
jgi:adenosine deaminase